MLFVSYLKSNPKSRKFLEISEKKDNKIKVRKISKIIFSNKKIVGNEVEDNNDKVSKSKIENKISEQKKPVLLIRKNI